MRIRDATIGDVEDITLIYNDAVANTTAIWDETLVDALNRQAWLLGRQTAGFPVVVAIDDEGNVTGYGSFGEWRAWDGYRQTVEHSLYVRQGYQRQGIGKTLLVTLIERAKDLEKHVMLAGIEATNYASIELHYKLGFEDAGRFREVGAKFGKWLDLAFLQLRLDTRTEPSSESS